MIKTMLKIHEYLNKLNKQFNEKLVEQEELDDVLDDLNNLPHEFKHLLDSVNYMLSLEHFAEENLESGKEQENERAIDSNLHKISCTLEEFFDLTREVQSTKYKLLEKEKFISIDHFLASDESYLPEEIRLNPKLMKDFFYRILDDHSKGKMPFLDFIHWIYEPFMYKDNPNFEDFNSLEYLSIMELKAMSERYLEEEVPGDLYFSKEDITEKAKKVYRRLLNQELDENTFGF